ncbi:MAG: DUF167 domain-containing protein [Phycisphaerales bacterium]|nr:DUF167 domain-containing protein [Phycisphaerales bacterium]
MPDESPISVDGQGAVVLRVKAVPGASRDAIAGVLGDRLKIRVSAPPEGGKANRAICALVAGALGLRPRDVEVASGHTSPEKLLRVVGIGASDACARLGL